MTGRTLRISRRRALAVLAAGAGIPLLAGSSRPAAQPDALEWEGAALGARAKIKVHHPDRRTATRVVSACVAEIDRLENEFSLFRSESALSCLNRDGRLRRPSLDMRKLLTEAQRHGTLSQGAFDITIQPLWQLYARHFAERHDIGNGPPPHEVDRQRARVDFRLIDVSASEIAFAREGMAVTLNGIAQGYITDRVSAILRSEGFEHVLVNAGELRALGGRSWKVALDHPSGGDTVIDLQDVAIATSSGNRARFTYDGRFHHIIEPRSAACPDVRRAVSVIAPSATIADAVSTALCVLPAEQHAALLHAAGAVGAYVSGPGGPTKLLPT